MILEQGSKGIKLSVFRGGGGVSGIQEGGDGGDGGGGGGV